MNAGASHGSRRRFLFTDAGSSIRRRIMAVGDTITDLRFLKPDGAELRLPQLSADALVLIFLRHLA